ncbi:2-amino-4-hydroxy-6-hydroxymethyldihydropteridine diphosphokinase [Catenovulum sp. SM1970]|uniref:2-amino-4-hydroxy-6- hydroxymethyldihydropteridine diphosphokinase n=1 Tax=Marinifaba aquimaris TaxID=2741323 RepID=UPI0015739828|nr:2-amino-4-hydroxy-6-hydroxymethyldihydropteridine diphosphokinase [Marinifaba aquimaris]NTS78155.1 2-amino-4-hydroxy-6-hydroxymethyldihydropteridine diphosphokinase [Marinifaba aquimaris]
MARIYISVGTSVNKTHHLKQCYLALNAVFSNLVFSRVFESESVGYQGDIFYNLVVGADTDLAIADVVKTLKAIEDDNGRIRDGNKFCGRTLDLDLLTFDDVICESPVELPRDEITKNAFVLWPLSEVAGDEIHPVEQQSYRALWQAYDKQKQVLAPIAFTWPAAAAPLME